MKCPHCQGDIMGDSSLLLDDKFKDVFIKDLMELLGKYCETDIAFYPNQNENGHGELNAG